jgi:hypothetical protein
MADETVRVTLTANTKPYTSAMDQAAASTSKVDKAAAGMSLSMAKTAAAGAGLAIGAQQAVGQLQDAVGMAVNLQDSISKVGVIFGKSAADIRAFAEDSSRSFGLTQTAALDAASTFAIFGKSAGLAGADLTKFSIDLTQRAVDLKSFFGGSVEDAITAVGAALRGESEPIRAYGVLLDDATLKARALTMGLVENTKDALTPQTRALAAAAEVMAQTSDAAGDYERTMGGAANSMNEFNAQVGRLKEEFGTSLLPALTQGAQALTVLIGLLGDASDAADKLTLGMFKIGTLLWWQNLPLGAIGELVVGTNDAADATTDLGAAAAGAAGGVGGLGAAASVTGGQVGSMTDQVKAAIDELHGFIDARQGLLGAQRDLRGIGSDILDAARQPGSSGAGRASEAESKSRQKVIDKIREQDHAEQEAEINRARRRAQARAEAAADSKARADTQSGVKGAIDTDKAARRGEDIEGSKQRGTIGEATGSLTKAQQKKLDKEIEGIRARHKKALDAQIKGLEGASKAASGAAGATDTYSTSLSENTEAGRRNLDQLDRGADTIQAIGDAAYGEAIRQGKSVEEAARISGDAMRQARVDLLDTYESLGFARSEVEKYLTSLGLIPKKITTTLQVNTSALDAAAKRYGPGLGKVWNPTLGAWMPGPTGSANPSITPIPRRAAGGEIHGPGGPRSDSVPVWASAGEFMVNAPQYAANRDLVRAINAGHGPVSGGGMSIGAIHVTEATASGIRVSVIDGLAEAAYRHGVVR